LSLADWSKQIVKVPELYDSTTRAYEQCVVAGPFIFVAGQIGWDKEEGLVSLEFEPQVHATFANIRHALRAAGADLKDIVSMTVYLTDPRYMDEFLRIRGEVLGTTFAASAMIGIATLYHPAMLVEIQAVAVRPGWSGDPKSE
jgi:2-iminobutanoate/2-iminopropanoate deaminase